MTFEPMTAKAAETDIANTEFGIGDMSALRQLQVWCYRIGLGTPKNLNKAVDVTPTIAAFDAKYRKVGNGSGREPLTGKSHESYVSGHNAYAEFAFAALKKGWKVEERENVLNWIFENLKMSIGTRGGHIRKIAALEECPKVTVKTDADGTTYECEQLEKLTSSEKERDAAALAKKAESLCQGFADIGIPRTKKDGTKTEPEYRAALLAADTEVKRAFQVAVKALEAFKAVTAGTPVASDDELMAA